MRSCSGFCFYGRHSHILPHGLYIGYRSMVISCSLPQSHKIRLCGTRYHQRPVIWATYRIHPRSPARTRSPQCRHGTPTGVGTWIASSTAGAPHGSPKNAFTIRSAYVAGRLRRSSKPPREIHGFGHGEELGFPHQRVSGRMARKQKGSNNQSKARIKVAQAHRKVRAARQDFLHRTSTSLVRQFDTIAVET